MHTYLNSEHPEAAYHCGRLMAILARIQSAALDKREGTQDGVVITRLNAGVVQRYYAAASKTPGLTLGRLTCYSQNHLEKLYKDQPKLARWLEKHLAEIMCRLKDEVPASLTLKEQSLFALGYYQQIAALNTRKKENNESNQAEEN